jgi:hypothetical protein
VAHLLLLLLLRLLLLLLLLLPLLPLLLLLLLLLLPLPLPLLLLLLLLLLPLPLPLPLPLLLLLLLPLLLLLLLLLLYSRPVQHHCRPVRCRLHWLLHLLPDHFQHAGRRVRIHAWHCYICAGGSDFSGAFPRYVFVAAAAAGLTAAVVPPVGRVVCVLGAVLVNLTRGLERHVAPAAVSQ